MFTGLLIFDRALATKPASLKIHLCQIRLMLVDVNSNEFLYYPFDLTVNKCDGICNTIDNRHT